MAGSGKAMRRRLLIGFLMRRTRKQQHQGGRLAEEREQRPDRVPSQFRGRKVAVKNLAGPGIIELTLSPPRISAIVRREQIQDFQEHFAEHAVMKHKKLLAAIEQARAKIKQNEPSEGKRKEVEFGLFALAEAIPARKEPEAAPENRRIAKLARKREAAFEEQANGEASESEPVKEPRGRLSLKRQGHRGKKTVRNTTTTVNMEITDENSEECKESSHEEEEPVQRKKMKAESDVGKDTPQMPIPAVSHPLAKIESGVEALLRECEDKHKRVVQGADLTREMKELEKITDSLFITDLKPVEVFNSKLGRL